MKFIDINKLEEFAEEIDWERTRQGHLEAMEQMNDKERKKYINDHPDWNLFQPKMMELSQNKCWYTEAPIGNNDFSVDHFRPKNRAVYAVDYKDPESEMVVTKPHGYWWKAYCWDNFRLSGTYSNLRRRDRLNPTKEPKGKGFFFPLDLENGGRIANDKEDIFCEVAILLDPTVEEDVSLLTFDSNGEVISAGYNDYEDNRVQQSIFYYHLNLEQLSKERFKAWKDCEREIKRIKNAIDNAPDERARRFVVKDSFQNLRNYVKDPERSYTSVVKACIMLYSEIDGYKEWLKRYVKSNLL
jgi:hypothetical protein